MNKATIMRVYKQNIVHKNLKGKLKKQVVFSLCVFGILISCLSYVKIFMSDKVDEFYAEAGHVFNPIIGLYNENESAIFISNNNAFVASKDLVFTLPVRSGEVNINNGVICMTVQDSIMVYATEGGIVSECGIANNNTKYIKIIHSENIYSIVENVDVIGCEKGDIVKKGREIATSAPKSVVKISFFENNKIVTNVKVDKNIISWM